MLPIQPMRMRNPSSPPPPPPVVYSAWNPADKNAAVTLTDSDRRATLTANPIAVRSTGGKSAGKWYVEMQINTLAGGGLRGAFGVAKSTAPLNNFPGNTADAWAWVGPGDGSFPSRWQNNSVNTSSVTRNYSAGDRLRMALDMDNGGKLFWGNASGWLGGGDPVAGTSPAYTVGAGAFYVIFGGESGPSYTIVANPLDYSYSIPTGYSAWTA